MKKTTRIAALLAAAALIFGGLFFSCSDDPEETNEEEQKTSISKGDFFVDTDKTMYVEITSDKDAKATIKGIEGSYSTTYKVNEKIITITVTDIPELNLITGTISDDFKTITLNNVPMPGSTEPSSLTLTYSATKPDFSTGGAETPTSYTLDFEKCLTTAGSEKKVDDVITISAQAENKKIEKKEDYGLQMTGGSAKFDGTANYGLKITLTQTADITIKACGKEAKGNVFWVLIPESSTEKKIQSNEETPQAKETKEPKPTADEIKATAKEVTFADVAAGTYMLGAASNGGYLTSLVITYK